MEVNPDPPSVKKSMILVLELYRRMLAAACAPTGMMLMYGPWILPSLAIES